jgi:cobalt/nickel transport protein
MHDSTNFRRHRAARAAGLAVLLAAAAASSAARAHFQLLHLADAALNTPAELEFTLLFTHPAHGGPHMDMGEPEAFYVISQRGDAALPVRTDLREYLTPIAWQSENGETAAYEARLPRRVARSIGDYVFVLEPAPYYEGGEDKYIQQFTKTIVNIAGVPGNWAEPVGLPAEILPLDKPYANWTGGVFRGVVTAGGEPVPFAELEVEYINHAPDLDGRRFADEAWIEFPQDSFGTMSIRADSQGEFTIGLPRAGWWGICALEIGADTEHEGKPLSQDAVLWVQVRDMQ